MKNNVQKFTISSKVIVPIRNEDRKAENVCELCDRIRFMPRKIVQIGAAGTGLTSAEAFEFQKFVDSGTKIILFEPHPQFFKDIEDKWKNHNNITLFNLGIYNKCGKFKFYEKWASTCLEECSKNPQLLPSDQSFNESDVFYANCALFSGFDDGDIDLLLIDTNGAEWYCIEKLISRPVIICVETHCIYSQYKTLHINKIFAWMELNNYQVFAQNESDTVFVKHPV